MLVEVLDCFRVFLRRVDQQTRFAVYNQALDSAMRECHDRYSCKHHLLKVELGGGVGLVIFQAVRGEDAKALLVTEPEPMQPRGEPARARRILRVGQAPIVADERFCLREAARIALEYLCDGQHSAAVPGPGQSPDVACEVNV